MSLTPGTRIGPFEVVSLVGVGGMGEVYRATDSGLRRDVALKVLPPAFADDPDRMDRMRREAQALAALSHPNIAAIYGVEQKALVMELVQGETIHGPLPLDTALQYARQIAGALEHAHEKGIIHRDLKPANVKVTADGVVKVLDFGLAKIVDERAAPPDAANSPTLSLRATEAGLILGTAAYMAPEQARGAVADRRADIWAFGVVLYEMLTGTQLFQGETMSDTLAGVLKGDLDLGALPAGTPVAIRTLLRRCLERDYKKRLQAIGEARITIEEVLAGGPAAESLPAPLVAVSRPRTWMAATAVLATLLLGSLAIAVMHLRETRPIPDTVAFDLAPPEGIGDMRNFDAPVVSPDGRYLALPGSNGLAVRAIGSTDVVRLDGSGIATSPFWSPDSRSIAYFRNQSGGGGLLKRVSISGGAPDAGVNLPWQAFNGAWGPDGTIVIVGQGKLYRIPAGGGALAALDASPGDTSQALPSFLPDGRHLIYLSVTGDLNNGTVRVRALDTNETSDLLTGVRDATYAQTADGTGRLLFVRAGELWAQTLDGRSLQLSGEPVRIATAIESRAPLLGSSFSASANGVLAYRVAAPPERSELVWYDRSGKSLGTVGDPAIYSNPALSADERWLAVSRVDEGVGARDIWVLDLARKAASRLTLGAGEELNPVWSPDGKYVAYSSSEGSARHIFRKLASGVGEPELLLKSTGQSNLEEWSRDGKSLLFNSNSAAIWRLELSGDGTPTALSKGTLREDQAQLSPDGRWMAYRASQGGSAGTEVYVQTFPPGENRWQISTAGGHQPRWRRDGRELFYLAGDQLMAVPVTARDNTFEAGAPRPLFRMSIERLTRRNHYVVSADGQRFLVVQSIRNSAPPRMTAVVNWTMPASR